MEFQMGFSLDKVVPWGRSFEEYVKMFNLSDDDLKRRILGCGDGPASFNASLTERGGNVVYIDPIYKNGGEPYIYYVDSVIIRDSSGLYKNQIDTTSIINILSKNAHDIKETLDDKKYLLLKKYIKKNYSWNKISTDLYNYLCDIIVQK